MIARLLFRRWSLAAVLVLGLVQAATAGESKEVDMPHLAAIRKGQVLIKQGKLAEAEEEFDKVREMKDLPEYLQQEMNDRIDDRLTGILRDFHIAPNGSNEGPGTMEKPFATLERARDEIRRFRKMKAPEKYFYVVVHGGRYRVTKTLELSAEDSEGLYRAADDEKPVFTGGIQVQGFTLVTDPAVLARLPEEARGKVWQADLKAHGVGELKPLVLGGFGSGRGFKTHPVNELFFNGQPMTLARWPNEGFEHIADIVVDDGHTEHGRKGSRVGRFRYTGDRPARWKDDKDVWLYGYWFWEWADSYEKLAGIDLARKEIALEPPYHKYGYRKQGTWCAVNLLSEIDRPGEWYLDREQRMLYFYAPSDPRKATVELSLLTEPFVRVEKADHVGFIGLTWELGASDGIAIHGGNNCFLMGCIIRRGAGDGVEIQGGYRHGITSCDIESMGRGGARISGGDRKSLITGGHGMIDCHIHHLSRIDHTYTPAVLLSGAGNEINGCLFHDIPSSAIRVAGNDHRVERCEVYNVVTESDDQGAVDMHADPTFRGNQFRFNYFHHIGSWRTPKQGTPCGQAGIRLDDAISGTLVYGNIFYRCSSGQAGFGGVQIHGGKDNVIDNNMFIDCQAAVSFSPWQPARWNAWVPKYLDPQKIDLDLYRKTYPELNKLQEGVNVNTVTRNLVVRCGQFLRRDPGCIRLGQNLVTDEDPGFVDAARGDFTLKPDAAALEKTGMRPIPLKEIGLQKSDFRKELPPRPEFK